MEASTQQRIREAEAKLRTILLRAQDTLAGRRDFTFNEIRVISEPIGQMEEIVSRATDLRTADIQLNADLMTYTDTLQQLQTTLEQVRFMLLARVTHLEAARSHLDRLNLWATAFNQTR